MFRISLLALIGILASVLAAKTEPRILVFAAASLKNVLEKIGEDFEHHCDCKIIFSFAGSGTLARQITAGAPADLFISADKKWTRWLQKKNAVLGDTTQLIAGNRLVAAVSINAILPLRKGVPQLEYLSNLFENGRIAIADPQSVPAGRYGRQALEQLGLWQQLSAQMVYGENVRVSLSLAARGDIKSAIVYFSDVKIEPRVKVAYIFDEENHDKIHYPASLVRTGIKASEFMRHLVSPPAKKVFKRFGFTVGTDD